QKIVLGCTHYPYLKVELSKLLSNMEFIDPAIYFAEFIKDDLSINGLLSNSNKIYPPEFYVSADPDKFKIVGNMFYDFKDSKVSLVKFSV
ncbi:glutamate racemase, partial [bacterium]|nr:glutamate racemase [bacterium]